jgi:hypothetical protein
MMRHFFVGHIRPARMRFLTGGVLAGVLAVGLAAALGGRAKAATNDPILSGNSGNASNPTLAEDATEVQYDGGGAPGVVFLAQADNSFRPTAAAFPAALAGWTTINPNITTGVYGYSALPNGLGVVGVGNTGVFGASSGAGPGVLAAGSGASGTALQIQNGGIRVPQATASPVFQVTLNGGTCTFVSNPLTDGDPSAILFATAIASTSVASNVYFEITFNKWLVCVNGPAIPITVNVLVIKR